MYRKFKMSKKRFVATLATNLFLLLLFAFSIDAAKTRFVNHFFPLV